MNIPELVSIAGSDDAIHCEYHPGPTLHPIIIGPYGDVLLPEVNVCWVLSSVNT